MHYFTLLSLTALFCSPILGAQEQADVEKSQKVENLLPFQKAFTNLPEAKRKAFLKQRSEAVRLFQEERIIETLEALSEAEKIFADAPEVLNLRASCYVKLRAFDKALTNFNKALKLTPDTPGLQFNIAEMYFVMHDWEKAHQSFEDLIKSLPPGRSDLLRLSEFKLMLCKLKLDRDDEAKILANKYDYLDDSPFHYYAKAVLAFEAKELLEAQQWMARAARIFREPAVLGPWQDTMVEFGYIGNLHDKASPEADQ